jgi:hypothetical protein
MAFEMVPGDNELAGGVVATGARVLRQDSSPIAGLYTGNSTSVMGRVYLAPAPASRRLRLCMAYGPSRRRTGRIRRDASAESGSLFDG